jgi:AcrR family transcriptional regulator
MSAAGSASAGRAAPVRRRRDAAATRSALLESARRLADTRAVPDFTVEDITAGAAVSRAAFYMHFDNKLAICQEVAHTTQTAFAAAARAFERGPGLRETIEAGLRAYVDGFRGDRPGMRMAYELAYSEPGVRALVHDTRTEVYAVWETEFARAADAGECPPLDVPVVARLLVGMLETFCVRTMRTAEYAGTGIDGTDPVPVIAQLWFRALRLD